MSLSIQMRRHAAAAALTGLALRLGFVRFFPATAGDSPAYLELARNLLHSHVYALLRDGRMLPTDARPPGYPLFIAAVELLAGRSGSALFLAQALLDLAACFLIAALAARLAPQPARERVWIAALWLSALCPFVANYAAVPLTEVLAAFFTALALWLLVCAWQREELPGAPPGPARKYWLVAGAAAGLATLVRAESGLILAAAGAAIAIVCARRRQWLRILRTGVWLAAGLLLPLLPWGVRNSITLGRLQFLSTRYAEMSGEFVPRGFYAWTNTWLVRFRDVYLLPWKIEQEPVSIADLPPSAFDSPSERERVARLFDEYNDALTITPEMDAQFAALARERTARHPLRTWLRVPLERAATIWLTPRVELLPVSGHVFPLAKEWEFDRSDLLVSLSLFLINALFLLLAAAGCWTLFACRRSGGALAPPPGAMFLLAYIVLRTVFLTRLETPEPRYVLVCFPAVIALAAQFWRRWPSPLSPPSPR
ncbi:MAG TPA: glycosyltransferase family 39 protein [Candidatus Acidoferrales bacterium]|nr:glycosyltransferase family 39 protein [Candidatus Acidoferrales bacterium]